jgi:hypothetical protein
MTRAIASLFAPALSILCLTAAISLPAHAAAPAGAVLLSDGIPQANYASTTGESQWYRINSAIAQKNHGAPGRAGHRGRRLRSAAVSLRRGQRRAGQGG